ncbi:heme biosynthesis HemY N-terminal domain-containing protein [Pseudomaricurvus sp. HS19]|uniref:heme biosynthesis HemY N-terminal domain-containing protein n=1 Tax=Pseudomaricurvus sp. HS19 TaxID=2692626 RepID=UPI0013719109|nr:heme biosynthesis HemY N-terminal domain-containing protein [Pseudomaricurvus sp. HS19]MYM63869.1 hypothetical protein [Pseudomaricurvus sp. HS19]
MKRLVFIFLACLIAGAGLVYWTARQDSYVLVSIGNWTLETSVWFALALILAGWLLWHWALLLIGGSVKSIGSGVGRVFSGGDARAQKRMVKGLISFIEGDWQPALRQLTRAAERSPEPLLNYLAAARSAYELGDEKEANRLLAKAEDAYAGAGLAVALTQARMQLAGKKYEACAATLERARKLAPRHPVVLDMLRQAYTHLHDWDALEAILPLLQRHRVIPEAELQQMSGLLYSKLLQQAGQSDFSAEQVPALWRKMPRNWRSDPDLLIQYSDLLEANGLAGDAELVLRKALQSSWDDRLVICYGVLDAADAGGRQLLYAEGWLKERPANGPLLLTLGRLALRNELWGKARDYLESSIRTQPSPDACAELARLLANLGEHEASTAYYQKGLLLTANALPQLPQPELSSERHDHRIKSAT